MARAKEMATVSHVSIHPSTASQCAPYISIFYYCVLYILIVFVSFPVPVIKYPEKKKNIISKEEFIWAHGSKV